MNTILRSSPAITLGMATILLSIAVAWGMQIRGIRELEKDMAELRVEMRLLRGTAFLNNVAEGLMEELSLVRDAVEGIERRLGATSN